MFLFIFLITAVLLAILPQDLVALLMPLIVWLATWAANALKGALGTTGFSGTVLVTLIVPALSAAAAWIVDLVLNPDLNFWILFVLGFLSVFINEMIKQWKQSSQGTQTAAKRPLIG